MTDDPLTRYAALMNRAHAPRELSRAVLDRIESQQSEANQTDRSNRVRRAPPSGGSCADAVLRQEAPLPGLRGCGMPAATRSPRRAVAGRSPLRQERGALGLRHQRLRRLGQLAAGHGRGRAHPVRGRHPVRVPPDDRYAEEGVYTGCMFRIEGDDIVRVQAHIDKASCTATPTMSSRRRATPIAGPKRSNGARHPSAKGHSSAPTTWYNPSAPSAKASSPTTRPSA